MAADVALASTRLSSIRPSALESFTGGLGTGAFLAFLMAITSRAKATTEYAILVSIFAFSRAVAGWAGGIGAQELGYAMYFFLTFWLSFPAYVLLPRVRRMLDRADAASSSAPRVAPDFEIHHANRLQPHCFLCRPCACRCGGCAGGFVPGGGCSPRSLVAAGRLALRGLCPQWRSAEGIDVGKQSQFSKLVPAEQVEQAAIQQYAQLLREARAKNALGARQPSAGGAPARDRAAPHPVHRRVEPARTRAGSGKST